MRTQLVAEEVRRRAPDATAAPHLSESRPASRPAESPGRPPGPRCSSDDLLRLQAPQLTVGAEFCLGRQHRAAAHPHVRSRQAAGRRRGRRRPPCSRCRPSAGSGAWPVLMAGCNCRATRHHLCSRSSACAAEPPAAGCVNRCVAATSPNVALQPTCGARRLLRGRDPSAPHAAELWR